MQDIFQLHLLVYSSSTPCLSSMNISICISIQSSIVMGISRPPFEGRQLVPFLLLLVGPILQNQLDSFAWFCVVLGGNESRFSCPVFWSYSHSECAYIKVSLSLLSRMFGTFLFRNLRIIRRIIRHPQPRNLHRVSLLFLRPNDIDS
jgi:hypothetical protein